MRPRGTDDPAAGGRPTRVELSCSFALRFIRLNQNSEGREDRFAPRYRRVRDVRETNIKRKLFPDLPRRKSNDVRSFFGRPQNPRLSGESPRESPKPEGVRRGAPRAGTLKKYRTSRRDLSLQFFAKEVAATAGRNSNADSRRPVRWPRA